MEIKNVLITGAGGFIGSHLAEECVERGYNVKAFVRYRSNNHSGWLEKSTYRSDLEVIAGDIQDFESVMQAMPGVDTVFHLAALIGIPYSYAAPLSYIRTNVEGTYNILQAARQIQTPNVLITSTSEVYGSAKYTPIDETHPITAQSPYAATKIAADQLTLSFHRSFGLSTKIVRPFNTFGPRQSTRAIIPTIIMQILEGRRDIVLGNVHPTRDLTFVSDTVNGFIEIAKVDTVVGEVTNIGMNTEISIAALVRVISQLLNVDISIIEDRRRVRPESSEVERLRCDNSKLLRSTSWRPEVTFEAGLEATITWLRENCSLSNSPYTI